MPIQNGMYVSPNWQNGGPPPLNAAELNALCQSVQADDQAVKVTLPTTVKRINSKVDMNTLPLGTVAEMDFNTGEDQSAYHTPLSEIGRGTEVVWYIVETYSLTTTRIVQIAHLPFSFQRETYIRYLHDATWSPWSKIYTSSDIADIWSALKNAGAPQIVSGSYVGTGTYGPDHPCSLTFDFVPKLIMLTHYGEVNGWYSMCVEEYAIWVMNTAMLGTSDPGDNGEWLGLGKYNSYASPIGYKSADGKTVYWYFTNNNGNNGDRNQFNLAGVTYHYVALG